MPDSPFDDPASFTSIDYHAQLGRLLLFQVLGVEQVHTVLDAPGETSTAVRVNLTVVDGPEAGTVIPDALVFPKVLVGQLRSRTGRMVLGRLGQGEQRPGLNRSWVLNPATDADKATAEAALNRSRIQGAAAPAAATPATTTFASGEPPF
jgi:hypothetical protein